MSSDHKPITIIGGGLAGLTLGIGLRRFNVPVTIWEAGQYPRHRVCGEFISGKGQNVLQRMGLLEPLRRAGARPACVAKFFLGSAESPIQPVEPAALCLSRFTLDHLLAKYFQGEGGDLRQHSRWKDNVQGEGIICANGRRLQTTERGWRWFGLKVHADQVELEADLEIHGSSEGYIGLCRLPGGEVNICGLFRRRAGADVSPPKELLRGLPGTPLHHRLENARFEESSFCSVAGLSLRPRRASEGSECRLGDALTMIPPVTGNGMSMALEAADLAVEPVRRYACGEISWSDVHKSVTRACDSAFRRRLLWAKYLQIFMFSATLRGRAGEWLLSSRWLWQMVFTLTR